MRDPRLPELYSQYLRKVDIQTRIRGLEKKIQVTKDTLQLEELKCRNVLQVTKIKEELAVPLRAMQEYARRIAKVSVEAKLPIDEEDYVRSFKVELIDAVIQWCGGTSFSEICKVTMLQKKKKTLLILFFELVAQLTDQFEGTIIRVFRRLRELILQMSQAAKVIGNMELQEKFGKAVEMLESPNSVIFCSSLYI